MAWIEGLFLDGKAKNVLVEDHAEDTVIVALEEVADAKFFQEEAACNLVNHDIGNFAPQSRREGK